MKIRIEEATDSGDFGVGLVCWLGGDSAYLVIKAGTACEKIMAEVSDGGTVRVLKVWPGDEECRPLLCAEVVPPHYYVVEVSPDDGMDNVVFRVLEAVDCGGKGIDVVGLVGECVPGTQSHTPR